MADLVINTADIGLEPSAERGTIETVDVDGRPVTTTSAGKVLAERVEFHTDADGTHTATLPATGDLDDDDVFYQVTIGRYSRRFVKASGSENLVATELAAPPAPFGRRIALDDLTDVDSDPDDRTAGQVLTWDADTEQASFADPTGGGSMSASEILTALKTVDGPGSGLDADTLDGLSSTAFAERSSNLSDLTSAATAFANIKQAASDTATGVVELATTAETQTGTDTARAVTPAGAAATYIPASLVDAAGDLITATADNTPARLAKGTPLQRLRTNIAGTALEWGSAGAASDRTWLMISPQSGSTIRVSGAGGAHASTGSITTPSVAAVGYAFIQAVSAASGGAGADIRQTTQAWYRGAASDPFAGFRYFARVRLPDASYNETGASTGSLVNVGVTSAAPVTARRQASVHGAVFNREHQNGFNTDINWNFVVNDGGATATTVNTGVAFAVGNVYEMEILCPAGGTSIRWTIWNRTAGTTATGTVDTDLPGATTAIYPGCWLRTVDAVARTLQVGGIYVEAING